MKRIIAATQNKHKIEEIDEMTRAFGFEIVSRDDAGVGDLEVVEDGETFEENSFKKANEIMKVTGEITIADDSGLEVDYLDGAPGVYSARFAGEDATDQDNNEKLITLLKDVPYDKRTARYVCVITLVIPNGKTLVARGEVEGHIVLEASGKNGFGYDPYFVPEGYDKTFGNFTMDEKNAISHRGKALEILRDLMEKENIR